MGGSGPLAVKACACGQLQASGRVVGRDHMRARMLDPLERARRKQVKY
eukprot:COSAG06_NODE_38480_length_423_cov_0.799383_2_plen_47_part_01